MAHPFARVWRRVGEKAPGHRQVIDAHARLRPLCLGVCVASNTQNTFITSPSPAITAPYCFPRPMRVSSFERTLERVRRWYGFYIFGYVVMPEHVHILLSEPERGELALALQMLKQIVSRKLGTSRSEPFWQRRYYDFNVFSQRKFVEKLRYMHRNPVRRGLVDRPQDWAWSSFRHYATGVAGIVEVESEWTARERERKGIYPRLRRRDA